MCRGGGKAAGHPSRHCRTKIKGEVTGQCVKCRAAEGLEKMRPKKAMLLVVRGSLVKLRIQL